MANDITINLDQLAEILHLSPGHIRNLSSTHPERLPPKLDLGGRKVLFLKSDVESWLRERSTS